MSVEVPVPENAKCGWEYESSLGTRYLYLRVDEESPKDELKAEYEYWEEQTSLYDIPMDQLKAIWRMLQWLDLLIER